MLIFPTSPIVNQVFTYGNNSWVWNGTSWVSAATPAQGTLGSQGVQGGTGAQGIQGLYGTQGAIGQSGPQGAQGITPNTTSQVIRNTFTGDGNTVVFILTNIPTNQDGALVFVDRVQQRYNDYSVSGNALIFASAPNSGSVIDVYIISTVLTVTQYTLPQITPFLLAGM